jgi:CDP-paratose 2-epimerase
MRMTQDRTLITGGAGFIGCNLANRLLAGGHDVTILDNLSRPGCKHNLAWLNQLHGERAFRLIPGNITDFETVRQAVSGATRVYHLAAQVAVTTSILDPRADFEANAVGTLNLLEAVRQAGHDPIVIYSSTNKVYGGMETVRVAEEATRYWYRDLPQGIAETQPLDFHSPYGCSKGAGDQYARDYARIYGLRTVVVRQSCIYGPRQMGLEDQGWLAWFMIAALKNLPITIYGNGKQVRDVLFVDDLLDAYDAMVQNIDRAAGGIYNIGGGASHTISIWTEFGPVLEGLLGRPIPVKQMDWRPGDQCIYVSDTSRACSELQWRPKVSVDAGIARVFEWVKAHEDLFDHMTPVVAHAS